MKTIEDLSDDDLIIIFSFLDLKNCINISGVCHRFRLLARVLSNRRQSISFVKFWPKDLLDVKYMNNQWFEVTQQQKTFDSINFKNVNQAIETLLGYCSRIKDLDFNYYELDYKSIRLMCCPNLIRLNLKNCSGFELSMAKVIGRHMQQLKVLKLANVYRISDSCLEIIIKGLRQLTALDVSNTDITGRCLSEIAPTLTHLNVYMCRLLKRKGLEKLIESEAVNLKELSFSIFEKDINAINEVLTRICDKFLRLTYLNISDGLPNLDHGISSIRVLRDLEVLIMKQTCVLDNANIHSVIHNCRNLKELEIVMNRDSVMSDVTVIQMSSLCKQLTKLEISYTWLRLPFEIGPQSFCFLLNNLPKLRSLSLCRTSANDEVVHTALLACKDLTNIRVDGCRPIHNHIEPQITLGSLFAFLETARIRKDKHFVFSALKSHIIVSGQDSQRIEI